MHGLLRLVPCLALTACIERAPASEDSDSGGSTTSPVSTTAATDDSASGGTDDSASGGTDDAATDGVSGAHAGPCKPIEGNDCPTGHVCCSDDPATVQGLLPNYFNKGVVDDQIGTPLFSDANNDRSYWGYCIDTSEFVSPLGNGCPVPCNPTWTSEQNSTICGGSRCCPFTAVDPAKDCVVDPDSGRWRTVRGADFLNELTGWGNGHTTHQDPFLESCELLADGDEDARVDCIRQLGVADQRGYCFALDCPCVEDVCDQKNPDYVPRCD